MTKVFELFTVRDADLYGKRQTAIYKQFLKALEGVIWSIRGTNQEITPSVIKEALEQFDEQYQICLDSLSETDLRFPKDLEWDRLFEAQNNHFRQVKKQFINVVKFGQEEIFHYFEAQGAIGLLAQRYAGTVHWRFENRLGSKYDALYAFELAHRDFAYQSLLTAIGKEKAKDKFQVVNQQGVTVYEISADNLANRNSAERQTLFHVGSHKWIK